MPCLFIGNYLQNHPIAPVLARLACKGDFVLYRFSDLLLTASKTVVAFRLALTQNLHQAIFLNFSVGCNWHFVKFIMQAQKAKWTGFFVDGLFHKQRKMVLKPQLQNMMVCRPGCLRQAITHAHLSIHRPWIERCLNCKFCCCWLYIQQNCWCSKS